MKTKLGKEIEPWVRGIVYVCDFSNRRDLKVIGELLFHDQLDALTAYSEIPNPESQIVLGKTHEDVLAGIERLHKFMSDSKWLNDLSESI